MSTGKSPFEIVQGYFPRSPSDLILGPYDARVSQPASTLHALSNDGYKLSGDVHHRAVNFEVSNFVMAHI